MKRRKPLTDENGEVRELLIGDIKKFQPASEVVNSSLATKLGIKDSTTKRTGADDW